MRRDGLHEQASYRNEAKFVYATLWESVMKLWMLWEADEILRKLVSAWETERKISSPSGLSWLGGRGEFNDLEL